MDKAEFQKRPYATYLAALLELEEAGYYVSATGLRKVLLGEESNKDVQSLNCFGLYGALPARAFHSRIHSMVRSQFLNLRYNEELGDYLLLLTDESREVGKATALQRKVRKDATPTIIAIKETR